MELPLELIFRLLVAGILGAAIGLEREYRAKEAGYRTHFLISMGSALFMLISIYGFEAYAAQTGTRIDPGRIAAQVVSGIGFLGAGTIVLQKQFIRGLTTAAGMWATAGIGLAIGCGMYGLGIAATLFVLAGLELLGFLFRTSGYRTRLIVFSTSDADLLPQIVLRFESCKFKVISYEMTRHGVEGAQSYQVSLMVKGNGKDSDSQIHFFLKEFPNVVIDKIA